MAQKLGSDLQLYEGHETIGSDYHDEVYKSRVSGTDNMVYIKTIRLGDGSEGVPTWIIRKVSLLREMDHTNVVRLQGISNDVDRVYVVFEHIGISLKKFMNDFPQIASNPGVIKLFLRRILCGVSYYHDNNMCHGALNSESVLIDPRTDKLKIADVVVTTPSCKAPELLLGFTDYDTSVDMWSVGCIFAEMVTHKPLFPTQTESDEINSIFRVMGTPTEETWPGATEKYEKMGFYTKKDPMNLASFFPGLEPAGMDLLSKMLCMNPSGRITVDLALKHDYLKGIGA